MEQSWMWWGGFLVAVLAMLAVDLGVFQRRSHQIRFKEALLWSIFWIAIALVFNLGLWLGWIGSYPPAERSHAAITFLTAYLLEKSLSVDNLFVFSVIFSYFAVPPKYHHRVLFYGILGALVFRAIFIFGGLWLIEKFAWMVYVFGVFLIITGIKLGLAKDKEIQPDRNPVLRLARAVLPLTNHYVDGHFITRHTPSPDDGPDLIAPHCEGAKLVAPTAGRLLATPLLLVLIFIEVTDVMFAVDSIPAVIGVTRDSFIVFTSNVFAILGLRAIYFVIAAFVKMFHYLSHGLAVLLVFIGVKMLTEPILHYKMKPIHSLAVVAMILTVAVVASLLRRRNTGAPAEEHASAS